MEGTNDDYKKLSEYKNLTHKFDKMMKALYGQRGAQLDIDILASDEAQSFINAHAGILDSTFKQVKMTDKMRERLTRSNYIFSGIKTFHELNEAFPSLLDEDGNRKPFERFLNDVRKIDETYNANYLHAEYNFVQASAEMAAKWEQYSEDGDRYLLQYRTAHDDKVRPEHAALDRITLPMSDPFWESYYPPLSWNCRCSVVQVRRGKYEETPHNEAMSRGEEAFANNEKLNMFRFNSGIQGKTMPDYNPYTIKRCNDCDVAKGKLGLVNEIVDNQLCAACRLNHQCWSRKEDNAPEVFYDCEVSNGKLRVSSKHGKTEKKENVRIGTYLAEKYGYDIDLIANPSDRKTADSLNKSLGYEQEYKVNSTPSKGSIDSAIRKASKQADSIILSIESEISLGDVVNALSDRVRRSGNITEITIILWNDKKDLTYTREQILSPTFKIRPEDFK